MTHESQIKHDPVLGLDASRFQGVHQAFPGHFHPYYFIGFIQAGHQYTTTNGVGQVIGPDTLLLFDPGQVHSCRPVEGQGLDYRCLNLPVESMVRWVKEITGQAQAPHFSPSLVPNAPQVPLLRSLHCQLMEQDPEPDREEMFLLLLASLLEDYAQLPPDDGPDGPEQVRAAERYLRSHYHRNVGLEELSLLTGWSRYRLIRAYTRQTGLTPHSYLVALRVNAAKALLSAGASPAQAALEAGFADQSHLTRHFKRRMGLTPGQYAQIFSKEVPPHA